MDDTAHTVSIDGYSCITSCKQPDVRASSVANYEKHGAVTMATPHLLMHITHVEYVNLYA
jgi:hypothetical protein